MLHLILGGQRSGKSLYAEGVAKELAEERLPLYLATSRIHDEEHARRILEHRHRRGEEFETVEEERNLSSVSSEGRVVLLECVTLWLTNLFLDADCDGEQTLREAEQELELFLARPRHAVLVSTETGLGVIPPTEMGRQFADLQGSVNQMLARRAERVDLVVAGIPLSLKR